jgi:hypothetical protein
MKTVGELRAFLAQFDDATPVALVYENTDTTYGSEQTVDPLGVMHARPMVHDKGWIRRPGSVNEGEETVLLYSEYAV